jgi:hypothetical protein
MPADEAAAMQRAMERKSALKAQKRLLRAGGLLKPAADLTDDDIKVQAFEKADQWAFNQGLIDETTEVFDAETDKRIRQMYERYRLLLEGQRQKARAGIEELPKELQGVLSETMELSFEPTKQYRERQGVVYELDPETGKERVATEYTTAEPEITKAKRAGTMLEKLSEGELAGLAFDMITARGRGAQAGITAAHTKQRRAMGLPQFKYEDLMGGEVQRGLPGRWEISGVNPGLREALHAAGLDIEAYARAPAEEQKQMEELAGYAFPEKPLRKDPRILGLRMTDLFAASKQHPYIEKHKGLQRPGFIKGALEAVAEGEQININRPVSPLRDPRNLKETIMQVRGWYVDEAARLAIERVPPDASDEELGAEAERLYKIMLQNDVAADLIEHPEEVQLAVEIGGDLGLSAKLPKALKKFWKPAHRIAREVGGKLGVVYMQGLDDLSKMGPKGEQLASELRMAADYMAGSEDVLDDLASRMAYAFDKAKSSEEATLLDDILHGKAVADDAPKHLQEAAKLLDDARDEYWKVSEPVMRRLEKGRIVPAEKVEQYVPRVLEAGEDPKAAFTRRAEQAQYTTGVETRGAMARGEDVPEALFDPRAREQFAASIGERKPKIARAVFTKTAIGALERNQALARVKPSDVGAHGAETFKKRLSAHWGGVKVVDIKAKNPELARQINLATQAIGGRADEHLFVPEAVYKEFENIFTKVHPDRGGLLAEEALHHWAKAVGAIHKPWRLNKTMLSGMQYYTTNTMGNMFLTGVAHGIKAANPKLQAAAAKTAWLAAGFGDETARAAKYQLRSGKFTTLGEIHDIMKSTGQFRQDIKKLGLEPRAVGETGAWGKTLRTFDRLAEWQQRVTKKIGAQKLSSLGDDYGHAAVFIGALEDTTPKAIAKALDFTEEYIGLYNRLTPSERKYMREIFPFYAWNKFIIPRLAKTIVNDPQRLSWVERVKREAEKQYGWQSQLSHEQVPSHLQYGFTAPPEMQPEKGTGVRMLRPEVGLSMLTILNDDEATLSRLTSPVAMAVASALSGHNLTGKGRMPGKVIPDIELLGEILQADLPGTERAAMAATELKAMGKKSKIGMAARAVSEEIVPPLISEGGLALIQWLWQSGDANLQDMAARSALKMSLMRRITGAPIYEISPERTEMFKRQRKAKQIQQQLYLQAR